MISEFICFHISFFFFFFILLHTFSLRVRFKKKKLHMLFRAVYAVPEVYQWYVYCVALLRTKRLRKQLIKYTKWEIIYSIIIDASSSNAYTIFLFVESGSESSLQRKIELQSLRVEIQRYKVFAEHD